MAVITSGPAEPGPGVKVTEHWLAEELMGERIQLLNVPGPLLRKNTGPVGAMVIPTEVSVTVAVQVVGVFMGTRLGLQLTVVEVVRLITVRANVPALPE